MYSWTRGMFGDLWRLQQRKYNGVFVVHLNAQHRSYLWPQYNLPGSGKRSIQLHRRGCPGYGGRARYCHRPFLVALLWKITVQTTSNPLNR